MILILTCLALDSLYTQGSQASQARRQEVFQGVRSCARQCNNIDLADKCLSAYFENVHPIIPVLHREAFYGIYRLYIQRALPSHAKAITDASTRDGRAVMLINSVLALGALTLVVDENTTYTNGIDGSQHAGFGFGLGFYMTSLRLSAHTHDNIETMLAYFFMVSTS